MITIWVSWMCMTTLIACGEKEIDTGDTTAEPNLEDSSSDTQDDTDTSESSDDTNSNDTTDDDGDGFSGATGDCDDQNSEVYPGAIDFPNDGVDQDCQNGDFLITTVLDGLENANFDMEENGQPQGWSDLGDSLAWQGDDTNIFTINGDSEVVFDAHTDGGGSLKLWGDYGQNPLSQGEAVVYQQFLAKSDWSPAEQSFWVDAWFMTHDVDPLQGSASVGLMFRCFQEYNGTWTLLNEAMSEPLTTISLTNDWHHLYATVTCDASATILQVGMRFHQQDASTDHGAVFVDDVTFGAY